MEQNIDLCSCNTVEHWGELACRWDLHNHVAATNRKLKLKKKSLFLTNLYETKVYIWYTCLTLVHVTLREHMLLVLHPNPLHNVAVRQMILTSWTK